MTDSTVSKAPIRFQRANFLVRDLDRALVFYRDVLGLEVAFIKRSEPTSYSYEVFDIPRDAALRFAVLSAPGQPRVMALTEVTGRDLAPVPAPRRAAIVLEAGDLDAVIARARAAGFGVCPEGVLITQDGRRGREIGLIDADDNLTVLYALEPSP